MATRNIGGIYAELSLRDLNFRRGLKAAGAGLKSLSAGAARMAGNVAMAGAAASGAMAAGLAVGTKKTIAAGAELDHLSSQTGVAVSSLMKIQQAYKDAGKGADTAGKDINKMQRAIYEAAQDPGGSMDYFADLGMSAADLMQMSPEEQFFAIGEALKGVGNQTKQAALAMDIFGRSGGELLTVFKGSNLEDVNAALGRMPEVMEQMSVELERADTLMGRLPNKADQFFAGFTSGVIGDIVPGLERIDNFDFTDIGESLGNAVADGVHLLTSGAIWDVFSKGAEIAVLKLDQQMGGLMNSVTAHMLAISDVLSGKGGFSEGIIKYSSAGLETEEDIKRLESEIRSIMEGVRRDRSPILGPMHPDFLPDNWSGWESGNDEQGTSEAVKEGVKAAMQETTPPWESGRYDVNEMQARGLANGATMVSEKEDEQISLLTAIRDAIREAARNREPVWG